jgi:hypothetical protein
MQWPRGTLDRDLDGAMPVGRAPTETPTTCGDAVAAFVELDNTHWLIERLGHRTPRETYQHGLAEQAAPA